MADNTPDQGGKIFAPWDNITALTLNTFQTRSGLHPFTCPREHAEVGEHVLVANNGGWFCPDMTCDYTQWWAHAFMADQEGSWVPDQSALTPAPAAPVAPGATNTAPLALPGGLDGSERIRADLRASYEQKLTTIVAGLLASYEQKLADFARETLRTSELTRERDDLRRQLGDVVPDADRYAERDQVVIYALGRWQNGDVCRDYGRDRIDVRDWGGLLHQCRREDVRRRELQS